LFKGFFEIDQRWVRRCQSADCCASATTKSKVCRVNPAVNRFQWHLQASIHAISGKVLFQPMGSKRAGRAYRIRFTPLTKGCLFHLFLCGLRAAFFCLIPVRTGHSNNREWTISQIDSNSIEPFIRVANGRRFLVLSL
jgi:hypothetical protein